MTDWLIPDELAPSTSGSMGPLYEAAHEGRLAMPFCDECGLVLEVEQVTCDRCGGKPRWRDVEPAGHVHSCTAVHRREPGLVLAEEPYQVLDIELSTGHRLVMTTQVAPGHQYRIGERVTIGFRRVGGVALPAVASTLGTI